MASQNLTPPGVQVQILKLFTGLSSDLLKLDFSRVELLNW